jgi:hypothetical protein
LKEVFETKSVGFSKFNHCSFKGNILFQSIHIIKFGCMLNSFNEWLICLFVNCGQKSRYLQWDKYVHLKTDYNLLLIKCIVSHISETNLNVSLTFPIPWILINKLLKECHLNDWLEIRLNGTRIKNQIFICRL